MIPTNAGGSSPLARGLPGGRPGGQPRRRIIPARAGFTSASIPLAVARADHPRSRGVYGSSLRRLRRRDGSSPLARGLHSHVIGGFVYGRIIPARAGFTRYLALGRGPHRDHPRSRGVYRRDAAREINRKGSSPLARGLLLCAHQLLAASRIIPARAGFTVRFGD